MAKSKLRYAVALINGDDERIMGVFDTKSEADAYGKSNLVPTEYGLQLCYLAMFSGDKLTGNNISIYNFYNR